MKSLGAILMAAAVSGLSSAPAQAAGCQTVESGRFQFVLYECDEKVSKSDAKKAESFLAETEQVLGASVAKVEYHKVALPAQVDALTGVYGEGVTLPKTGQIFSTRTFHAFGALVYEMVTGTPAFRGASSVETMNAILKEDPPALAASGTGATRALARVIEHCLEKDPAERFQSARDLAFQLEAIDDPAAGGALAPARPRTRIPPGLAWLAAGLAAGAALHAWLAPPPPARVPEMTRLTFRRGTIEHARFASDGATVVYSAAWDGAPVEVFTCRPGSPESRPLGFADTELLALSASGEMALSHGRRRLGTFVASGTLARAPLSGGASRAVLEDVQFADWAPDGALAIVRTSGGRTRLEYPVGTVLHETSGWISHPRVAPDGRRIAFLDHPVSGDDGGNVAVVAPGAEAVILSREWGSLQGLAWRDGREVWFTGTREGAARALHSVTLDGRERAVLRMAGTLTLHDVAAGQVLFSNHVQRREMRVRAPGESAERDFSWLDYAFPSDFADDGSRVYFAENGEGGGRGYSVYLRATAPGRPAVRLGSGAALALAPGGERVLAVENFTSDEQRWMLLPTAAGEPRALPRGSVRASAATFGPDARRLFVAGVEPGRPSRVYGLDLGSGGAPVPLGPEGVSFPLASKVVAPDGRRLAVRLADGAHALLEASGGATRPLAHVEPGEQVLRWCGDACVYAYAPGRIPAEVFRVDLASGRRELAWQIAPADRAGVLAITPVQLSADGRAYVYGYRRVLSDLYVLRGL
ncbi:MAG: PD40 domain-containing protein [Vicinamibacteria bacterium]|nr:PD40 domain-containing protein [Vicinamibacteria bacterium]